MNIIEATKKALAENKCIKRESWAFKDVVLQPTDKPGWNCAVVSGKELLDYKAKRGWQPKAKDLIAEDWIVIGEAISL